MHVEKLAWAISLLDGARRLGDDNRIPLFLLLGFAVENALKAHLEKKGVAGNWKRSHNLADLYDKASAAGLAPIFVVQSRSISIRVRYLFRPLVTVSSRKRCCVDEANRADARRLLSTNQATRRSFTLLLAYSRNLLAR
jgi:hypothetical protein